MIGDKMCYLCGRNGYADPLERHRVYPGKNRANSERYGAVVYLCGASCHRLGENSAHRNKYTRLKLEQDMQQKIMEEQGWNTEDFIMVFGRNYL